MGIDTDDTLADVPQCVPARMVNEYVYCPRLAYLEWVDTDFVASYETVDGVFQHRKVNEESGALPEELDSSEVIHARSVWLSAPEERLTARIDLVEAEGRKATPVDYKRGSPPAEGGAWQPDLVQLCAQGLVLRANGYECEGGIAYYCTTRQRVPVVFTDELIAQTRAAVRDICDMAARGTLPPPLIDSGKCVRCSLAPVCLPDEVNFLARRIAGAEEDGIRRLVPARDDAMPLYVQQQGARIAKKDEVFEVWAEGARQAEARIFETSQISVFGNVQITTQALAAAADRGIPIVFFTSGGWFRAMTVGLGHKNAELRLRQFAHALSSKASLRLARQFVQAKVGNARTLVRRNADRPPQAALTELAELGRRAGKALSSEELLGIEGRAARVYFELFPRLLKGRAAEELTFQFAGRNRRPPTDPVNALLSYAYSLLAKEFTVVCAAVGLDPYVGFYHRPRYGRPALALDLMEEFRPIVADSVVIWALNNGVIGSRDFIKRGPAVGLTQTARRRFLAAYEQRLDALITHPTFGYRVSYRRVFEIQARLLARNLAGELRRYPAFRTR